MSTEIITRRDFLRTTAMAGAAAAIGAVAPPVLADDKPYGPFRMGIQSYSLRAFGLDEAAKTHCVRWTLF